MPLSMQKFRAFARRKGKTAFEGTSPTAKTIDTPCHPSESAQLHLGYSDPKLEICSRSSRGSQRCESMPSNEDASQSGNSCETDSVFEFVFISGTDPGSTSCIKRSDTKRKSIQFTETTSLFEPTSKSKKRMSLPWSGSGSNRSPDPTSLFQTSWLDESDIKYVDPVEIQYLNEEPIPAGTKNTNFFRVVLNSEDEASLLEPKESENAQAQGDLRDKSFLTAKKFRNEAKSEEMKNQDLGPCGIGTEANSTSAALPEKCATPRLSSVFFPEDWSSISTDSESQNWSAIFEDCASNIPVIAPLFTDDTFNSLFSLESHFFDFNSTTNAVLGNSYLPQDFFCLDSPFLWKTDGISSDQSLNVSCFECAEVSRPDNFSLPTFSYKDSILSKSKLPKPESKKPQPRYPCLRCDKYDGLQAFHRKDHLEQHLRTFHSVPKEELIPSFCKHSDCPESAAKATSKAFTTIVEYRRHLLVAHGESMFECKIPGCTRVGRWGFARETNLKKHMDKFHTTGEKAKEERRSCSIGDHRNFI